MSVEVWCSIYKHPKNEGMYLYVPKEKGLEAAPEALLAQIPNPEFVMDLLLTPTRVLAREDVQKVMTNLAGQGFHLQLPPAIIY